MIDYITTRMGDVMNISRILSRIRYRHCIAVLVQINVGPSFLRWIMLILVIRRHFRWTWISSDVATMNSLLAGVVALRGKAERFSMWTSLFFILIKFIGEPIDWIKYHEFNLAREFLDNNINYYNYY